MSQVLAALMQEMAGWRAALTSMHRKGDADVQAVIRRIDDSMNELSDLQAEVETDGKAAAAPRVAGVASD
jgi:hypothetical protein